MRAPRFPTIDHRKKYHVTLKLKGQFSEYYGIFHNSLYVARFESWSERHMWVEFVVGSLQSLLREVLEFPPFLKNQHFQIPTRSGTYGEHS